MTRIRIECPTSHQLPVPRQVTNLGMFSYLMLLAGFQAPHSKTAARIGGAIGGVAIIAAVINSSSPHFTTDGEFAGKV
jgi:hypothetical protein